MGVWIETMKYLKLTGMCLSHPAWVCGLKQQLMAELCPERKIIPVYARDILTGGGNIHCITQQIPAYIVSSSDK